MKSSGRIYIFRFPPAAISSSSTIPYRAVLNRLTKIWRHHPRFDADKGKFVAADGSWYFHFSDWFYYARSFWNFYHRELRHDAARFYSDYLPPGNYHVSYTAQAIASGEFVKMPTHTEEMYDTDVFGKGLLGVLTVQEPK